MTRDEAQAEVSAVTMLVGNFQAVKLRDANRLLGDEVYNQLCHDKLRHLGPAEGYVYPWNVVDYLTGYRKVYLEG